MSDQSREPSAPDAPASPSTGSGFAKESIWEVYYPFKSTEEKQAIPVASFPMIIYFWPMILTWFFCGIAQHLELVSPVALGWLALTTLAFNLIVIVHDLDQKKFTIVGLSVIVFGLLLYIAAAKEIAVLGVVAKWIAGMDPTASADFYLLAASLFLLFFVLGLAQPRFNYWRLEPNEFVHYIQPWGRDQSVPRLGSTVSREVPDVLELLLTFGGGSLVIKREGEVVARIQHVPFLGRRMKSIERLLGVTRVQHVDS